MLTASDANELKGDSVSPPFLCQYAVLIRHTIKTRIASGAPDSNMLWLPNSLVWRKKKKLPEIKTKYFVYSSTSTL